MNIALVYRQLYHQFNQIYVIRNRRLIKKQWFGPGEPWHNDALAQVLGLSCTYLDQHYLSLHDLCRASQPMSRPWIIRHATFHSLFSQYLVKHYSYFAFSVLVFLLFVEREKTKNATKVFFFLFFFKYFLKQKLKSKSQSCAFK